MTKNTDINIRLEKLCEEHSCFELAEIMKFLPESLSKNFSKWQFGRYGWLSPVNLFITASWYKHLHPEQDVCKIWSKDHKGNKIDGGFSIRTNDERYTVKLVSKLNIYDGYCSPNSGMQGARLIEKMRGIARIERDVALEQNVRFDIGLFQNILNDINECSAEQAKFAFLYLIKLGLISKESKESHLEELKSNRANVSMLSRQAFLRDTKDPQFSKVYAATTIQSFLESQNLFYAIGGISDSQSSSDSLSGSAGDLWYFDTNGDIRVGVEVKDRSKKLGFDVLSAIEIRLKNNPSIDHYIVIGESISFFNSSDIKSKYWEKVIGRIESENDCSIHFLTVEQLEGLISLSGKEKDITVRINELLTSTPNIKKETLSEWTQLNFQ